MLAKLKTAIEVAKTYKKPYIVFADRFRILPKSKQHLLEMRNGVRFKARPNTHDARFANEIWIHKAYTPEGFEINPGDTVVDIGGHIALFSIFAARYARQGIVYTFEPVPDNFEFLKQNLQLNSISNVVPIQKAVASESGKRTLYVSQSCTGGSSFVPYKDRPEELPIEALSLPDFIKQYDIRDINFLKMDCEGAEYEILFNCPRDILQAIWKLAMEIHNRDAERNVRTLAAFLEKNGFSVTLKMPHTDDPVGILYAAR